MSSDLTITNKDQNQKDQIEEEQIIKNICFDDETGRLILSDSNNNHFLCDLFGRKLKKFKSNVTGRANYSQRQKLFPINLKQSTTDQKKELDFSISYNPTKGFNHYFPSVRRFEGYSNFPRPIAPPFANIPDYEMKEKKKRELIDHLEKYFSDDIAKRDIVRLNENKGLSYFTCDLNEYDTIKEDTEHLLKTIEQTFETYKEKYKYKLNILHKNPVVKALTQFKKYLLSNKNAKIINSRQLKEHNPKLTQDYNIIQGVVNRFRINKYLDRNKLPLINSTYSTQPYTERNRLKYNKMRSVDRLNDLCNSRDLTIGKTINMDFGFFSYEEENKKNEEKKKLEEEQKKNGGEQKKNEGDEQKKAEHEEAIYVETEETRYNDSVLAKTKVKTLDEKINDNELSFISIMSENEKKYEELNLLKLKSLNNVRVKTENEDKLLKGFISEEIKPEKLLRRITAPKLKTNRDLFLSDLNLLRKTNPLAFKMQEKKDAYDLMQLKKKVQMMRINANNVMKGKILKIETKKEED